MTENWRKKMAMSLVLTLPDPNVGRENSLPFSRTAPGVIRSRRNCCSRTSLLAADRSPETFSPDALFPENVKTGILPSPQFSASLPRGLPASRTLELLLRLVLAAAEHHAPSVCAERQPSPCPR